MLRGWLPVALVLAVANASAAQPLQVFAAAGKYGFKDEQGGVRIGARYDGALNFAEGLAAVGRVAGKEVVAEGRYGAQCFVETLRWGYIDPLGAEVIRPRFQEARPFSGGRAAVRFDSKWGFIDSTGGWVVRPSFADVGDFHDGLAWSEPSTGDQSATSTRRAAWSLRLAGTVVAALPRISKRASSRCAMQRAWCCSIAAAPFWRAREGASNRLASASSPFATLREGRSD